MKEQRDTLRQRAANEATRGKWLAQKLANQDELYRDKLITLQTLYTTRQAILDSETELRLFTIRQEKKTS